MLAIGPGTFMFLFHFVFLFFFNFNFIVFIFLFFFPFLSSSSSFSSSFTRSNLFVLILLRYLLPCSPSELYLNVQVYRAWVVCWMKHFIGHHIITYFLFYGVLYDKINSINKRSHPIYHGKVFVRQIVYVDVGHLMCYDYMHTRNFFNVECIQPKSTLSPLCAELLFTINSVSFSLITLSTFVPVPNMGFYFGHHFLCLIHKIYITATFVEPLNDFRLHNF